MVTNTYNINSVGNSETKVFKYRWIIVTLYSLYSAIIFFQFQELTIISDVVEDYYQVSKLQVSLIGLIFLLTYLVLFIPIGYFVEKKSLYIASLLMVSLTSISNILKLFALEPSHFYLILIAQILNGIAGIVAIIIPSKLANTWFGPEEVSTACAIEIFGSQIGSACGCFLPAVIVEHNNDRKIMRDNFYTLYLYNVIFSLIVTSMTVILFRSKPPLPPSLSQVNLLENRRKEEVKITYWTALKAFSKNRDFLIVVTSFGIPYGLYDGFGTLLNQVYLVYFPDDKNGEVGILSGIGVLLGGCIGSIICGYILDKSNDFRKVSIVALILCTVVSVTQFILLVAENNLGSHLMIPLTCLFQGNLQVIAYEYSTETIYPTPEEFGLAICNAAVYGFAIFFILFLRIIYDNISYLTGHILVVVLLIISTILIFFVSPEMKRRKANTNATGSSQPNTDST